MTDPLNKIFLMLGEIRADQENMQSDIKEIKEGVADYNNLKNKLIGMCVFLSVSVGGGVSAALNKLGLKI